MKRRSQQGSSAPQTGKASTAHGRGRGHTGGGRPGRCTSVPTKPPGDETGYSCDPGRHLSALDLQGEAGEPSEAQRTVGAPGGGLPAGRMPHDQSPGACLGVCHPGARMSRSQGSTAQGPCH